MLDLFAGTGALGIEAMSRGARFALFVDDAAEARALIRENVEAFALAGVTRLFRRDATKLGDAKPVEPFDLVFCDPPYGHGFAEKALASARAGGWLAPGALIVVEEKTGAFKSPEGFEEIERRAYDDTEIRYPARAGVNSAPPEQLLDIGELQFHISRPAVIALAGIVGAFHGAQQRVHLLGP